MIKSILYASIFFLCAGCGHKLAEINAVKEENIAVIQQQGYTDRELLRLRMAQYEKEDEGKITVIPAPEQLPMITTKTPARYVDELGEGDEVVETRVDHVALAIIQLGKVAQVLAEGAGGKKQPDIEKQDPVERIVYQRRELPQSDTAEIIRAAGDALGKQSWIMNGVLGWIVGDTIQEVAKIPSHQGDYVQLERSFNPVTTKINEAVE